MIPDKDYILFELNKSYQIIRQNYPNVDIIGLFAYGSMNKGTWYRNSDVDFICLVNSHDTYTDFKLMPDNTTYFFLYDIQSYLKGLQESYAIYLNTLEPLFTDYYIINPKYQTIFNELKEQANNLVLNSKLKIAIGLIHSIEHHIKYSQFLQTKENMEQDWLKLYYHILLALFNFNQLYDFKSWDISINIPHEDLIHLKLGLTYTPLECQELIIKTIPQRVEALKFQLQFFNNTLDTQNWITFFQQQKEKYKEYIE